jgi:epoxyqueuosine reductase QueG
MWQSFAAERAPGPDPMDRWTKTRLEPLATELGFAALFPFDKPPLPFQRWAVRAAALFPSPLGLLIDPAHGLWHALRGAFLSPDDIALPEREDSVSPCDTCMDKPCLSACPVRAFSGSGLNVGHCAAHISSGAGSACMEGGCRARDACPIGRVSRYGDEQVRFHMDAYRRSVAPHARRA